MIRESDKDFYKQFATQKAMSALMEGSGALLQRDFNMSGNEILQTSIDFLEVCKPELIKLIDNKIESMKAEVK